MKEMVSSQVSRMEEMVHELNTTMYNIEEHDYQGRVFLCGDHMLNYKVNGRDAPTCTLPTTAMQMHQRCAGMMQLCDRPHCP